MTQLLLAFILCSMNALWADPLTGKFELRGGYFLTTTDQYPMSMGQGYLKVDKSISAETYNFKFAPTLIANTQDASEIHESTHHLKASELWFDYFNSDFDFGLGRQIIKWGAADGFNPTNPFMAYDLSDPIFPRELSQNAVILKIHPVSNENVVFEIVFVPVGTADVLPFSLNSQTDVDPKDSRWGTAFPTSANFTENIQVPLTYNIHQESYENSWDLGARLRLLQLKNWDYSFSLGQFKRKRAIIQYELIGNPNIPTLPLAVELTPRYPRFSMLGFDASGSIGEVGVRFETARYLVDSDDKTFGYDSTLASLGADYQAGKVFFDSEFYVNSSYVFIQNDKSNVFDNKSIDLSFTQNYMSLVTELRWPKWTLGNAVLLTEENSSVDNVYLKCEVSQDLNLGLSANFINGDSDSGIGLLSENHRLMASMEYFF